MTYYCPHIGVNKELGAHMSLLHGHALSPEQQCEGVIFANLIYLNDPSSSPAMPALV